MSNLVACGTEVQRIRPSKTVKTGKIFRNVRKWAMLDTLLTVDTISEAAKISERRMKEE
ncbi:hypothetical protein [Veillonella sp. CHU732]|uniref:hypothetical protein n=1 Tax=Veillonella sp. CHU732 TaxID=2490949 RepID=UPI0013E013A4|nr:hypothetical protein [Veillonella sp. CHU732]